MRHTAKSKTLFTPFRCQDITNKTEFLKPTFFVIPDFVFLERRILLELVKIGSYVSLFLLIFSPVGL